MTHDSFCQFEDPKYCQCDTIAKIRDEERLIVTSRVRDVLFTLMMLGHGSFVMDRQGAEEVLMIARGRKL